MSFSGLVLVGITALMTAAANVLLSKGINIAGGFSFDGLTSLLQSLFRLFLTPVFLSGFLIYFAASVVWFRILSSEPLGIAYPLVVSTTFVMVTLASIFIAGETATWARFVGLLVIIMGIVIISRS